MTGRVTGDEGFGLYVHWPFCVSKCPYCDFNSHVSQDVDYKRWHEALLAELDYFAERLPDRKLTSIFFGGGTPSLMQPNTTEAIIHAARRHWEAVNDLEITVEANPSTLDIEKFMAIHDAGVTRLSVGVQALNDTDLRFLGRHHTVDDARMAWRTAAKLFKRASFDLIYARPGQSPKAWRAELSEALRETTNEGMDHLSLYQLTMEPGTTMFNAHARGEIMLPSEEEAAALYDITQELCEKMGYPAYEVSNHAKGGAACGHNLTYWRGGDYAGIGPGSHGRLTMDGKTYAVRQVKAPALWLKRVAVNGHGTQEEELLAPEARAEELVIMGLRLSEGLDKARFARLAGRSLSEVISPTATERLISDGYLCQTSSYLTTTAKGRLALNTVLRELLA